MFDLIEVIVERFIVESPLTLLYLFLCGTIPCVIYKLLTLFSSRIKEKWKFQQVVWAFIFLLYLTTVFHLVPIGTMEYIRKFESSWHLIFNTTHSLSNLLLMIPLGIFLPLIWPAFRSFKKLIGISVSFFLLIAISQLFVSQTIEIGHFAAHMVGVLGGYLAFKYIYIFFHKGISFYPKTQSLSFSNYYEAITYLFLSFASVFFLYYPLTAMSHFLYSDEPSITILGYEMRNIVLIPISEVDLLQEQALDDEALLLQEFDYVIRLEDLEDEFVGNLPLCLLLGTCYEGFPRSLSEEAILMSTSPIGPLLIEDSNRKENQFLSCERHENHEFLLCIEADITEWENIIIPLEYVEKQFELTDDTIFQRWITDGFGEQRIQDLGGWDDFILLAAPMYLSIPIEQEMIRIYATEINGHYYAEKVIFFNFTFPLILPSGIVNEDEGIDDVHPSLYFEKRER